MTDYALVGGGGFGRELYDWFAPGLAERGDRFVGYFDDNDAPMSAYGRTLPQLGPITDGSADPSIRLVMALGGPQAKAKVAAIFGTEAFATLIHPTACVSASAKIGRGCVVGPFSIVSADTLAGEFVGLNAHASLGHDVQIGAFSTLSAYVDLTGAVKVGRCAFFGTGARVMPGLSIGDNCVIGAGAVMVRGAPADTTYYAAPARRL